jgi:hypothetical protein
MMIQEEARNERLDNGRDEAKKRGNTCRDTLPSLPLELRGNRLTCDWGGEGTGEMETWAVLALLTRLSKELQETIVRNLTNLGTSGYELEARG